MKARVLLVGVSALVLGLVMVIYLAGAVIGATEDTAQVTPRVYVATGGTISIVSGPTDGVLEFGSMGPGTSTQKTIVLNVVANNTWRVTASKNQNLTNNSAVIPSANFTFKSSGDEGPTYVTTDTEFGSGSSPTGVVTSGSPTSGCSVSVVYKLVIPSDQTSGEAGSSYSALHTYTVILG